TSFDDVHREAVRLAAEQALLRGNVNAMFTNLSRRSQGLIQRQLSLISELESREADPDQLSSLFKLDHLATRMRRNGENLLVLAGEEPGRRWTRPVPLVDVLRAAASEVEQYERIELAAVPATEVAGRVVNDLVHLLAELLENATSFSSPQTKVRVTGHALPDGRVLVEIHDTGIGLSPEDLAAINERLASPPTVDVSVSRRMGLFVVGRLSLRHGIRIQLRPSDSGGTTALVMLPVDVAQGGRKAPGAPGSGVPGGMPPGGPGGANRPGGPGTGATQGGPLPGMGAPQRGQVGAGSGGPGQRTALPSRDGGPPAGRSGGGLAGAFGNRPPQSGSPRGSGPSGPGGLGSGPGGPGGRGSGPGGPNAGDRGRQLPASGGPRPELPGGGGPQRPQTPAWGAEQPGRPGGPAGPGGPGADAPRGHEEGNAPRSSGAPGDRPGAGSQQPGTGAPFVRPDVFGPPAGGGAASGGFPARPGTGQDGPAAPGQFGDGRNQDPAETSPMPRIDLDASRPPVRDREPGATGHFARQEFPGPSAERIPGTGYQDPSSGQTPRPEFQNPSSDQSGQYARPGYQDPSSGQYAQPGYGDPAATGQYTRPDFQNPSSDQSGQYARPGYQDPSSGQVPRPEFQDPSSGQVPRPEFQDPSSGQYAQPGYGDPAATGQYTRPDFQDPSSGQYARPGYGDPAATGQFPRTDLGAPQPPAPGQAPAPRGYEPAEGHRPPALPDRPQPEALPPAPGPGDGRTPLFDTLETDWFHSQDRSHPEQPAPADRQGGQDAPAVRPEPAEEPEALPRRTPGQSTDGTEGAEGPEGAEGWRTSPNDELVRQAERIRKPASGGVTTSGLPRRVPRANLVAGTAQEQSAQSGPQVSRAPDDVRGRLTNLRRGIQQGRQQQNSSTTGSFNLGPTHPQER
ncbi:ATP-binding protein, partial [Streptomyces sp. NPDC000594]|uniref:ATP-binding protein n=1 Tax=Streptomyces sp. NPDC000594 TaxID=3154261 RepID=UPI003326CC55